MIFLDRAKSQTVRPLLYQMKYSESEGMCGLQLRREKVGRGWAQHARLVGVFYVCVCSTMLAYGEPNLQSLKCGDVFALSISDGQKMKAMIING